MADSKGVCGECTACCDVFPVPDLNKAANEKCIHCDAGCTIYGDRPSVCSVFECAYLQSTAPTTVRPDNCGVIFEKVSDRIFFGTVFKTPTRAAIDQTHSFINQGFTVVLASNTGRFQKTHLAPGHDADEIRVEFLAYVKEAMKSGDLRNRPSSSSDRI